MSTSHRPRSTPARPAPLALLVVAALLPSLLPAQPATRGSTVLRVTAVAAAAGLTGAVLGAARDTYRCERRTTEAEHRDAFLFDPCLLPLGGGTMVGVAGVGSFGGVTMAVHLAREHGCPARAAWMRAIGGALVGVAPVIPLVVHPPSRWLPRRTARVLFAPALSGAGAALATTGCGRRE